MACTTDFNINITKKEKNYNPYETNIHEKDLVAVKLFLDGRKKYDEEMFYI